VAYGKQQGLAGCIEKKPEAKELNNRKDKKSEGAIEDGIEKSPTYTLFGNPYGL
jgi:hypothetical protein